MELFQSGQLTFPVNSGENPVSRNDNISPLAGETTREITEEMDSVYGGTTPSSQRRNIWWSSF